LVGVALDACAAPPPMPAPNPSYRLPAAAAGSGVKAALIRTGNQSSREALTVAGGSFSTTIVMNYIAVLVRHPKGDLLFDAGLGRRIDAQYGQEMPFWVKPFLSYRDVRPAADQLGDADAARIRDIVLSHGHWDHASAIGDFPQAVVHAPPAELGFVHDAKPPAVLPSQFAGAEARLKPLALDERPLGAFTRSRDWFGDGSVVFVPLSGHTPGSIGLVLTTDSGRRYFFVGDAVWNASAVDSGESKPWFVRGLADHEAEGTLASLQRIREMKASNPDLTVVPAHDARVHDPIGYFPEKWLP
jgi:glyoxylase-like metal-dependent hydrolase (beta-lactamase superfamily II)